jgi:hypothetical protein
VTRRCSETLVGTLGTSLARAFLDKEGIASSSEIETFAVWVISGELTMAEGEDEERWRAREVRQAGKSSRSRVAHSAQWTFSMTRMRRVSWSVEDGGYMQWITLSDAVYFLWRH